MTALKGVLTGLCTFLLSISLVIFGILLTLNCTVLSPDYVSGRVDNADITEIITEVAEENIVDEIPEDIAFFEDVVYDVISDHEPWIREQIDLGITAGYDYLHSRTDRLEISIPLDDLKMSVRDSLWLHFMERLPEWLTSPDNEGLKELIYGNIYEFAGTIPSGYIPPDYQQLSEAQLRNYVDIYFDDIAAQITNGQLPPSLEADIEELLQPYFYDYYDEFVEDIPDEFVLDETEIDAETMDVLEEVRYWIGIFKTVFWAIIGFMVLLAAAVILLNLNDIKAGLRAIGITLTVYGAIELIAVIVARFVVPNFLPTGDIPAAAHDVIVDVFQSMLLPLQWFSLGVLIVGIGLIVGAIFIRSSRSDGED